MAGEEAKGPSASPPRNAPLGGSALYAALRRRPPNRFSTEDPVVKGFLAWDKNLRVSDKVTLSTEMSRDLSPPPQYLSMVVVYFRRAGLFPWQYQRIHFFIALYLASDIGEDNQGPKQAIFSFLYGNNHFQGPLFHKLRLQFVKSVGWKTWISRKSVRSHLSSRSKLLTQSSQCGGETTACCLSAPRTTEAWAHRP
ncbi:hypothetical protein MC885_016141 [Smutsia gigantea]|nr:hypothetical protein MC885_016141 [Smutsia gigantea]